MRRPQSTLRGKRSTKATIKREVIEKAQKERRTVHFATLMDLYHLKNSELEHKFPEIQRSSCAPMCVNQSLDARVQCESWFECACIVAFLFIKSYQGVFPVVEEDQTTQSFHMVAELCGWNPRTTSRPVVDLVSREWSPLRITVPHITQASVGTERIAVCARKA